MELTSVDGVRNVNMSDFLTGFRTTVLEPNELVTALIVPALGDRERGVFVKVGLRRAQAISVVHLAAVVRLDGNGTVTAARAALGSVAPTVIEVPGLAEALIGRPLDSDSVARGRYLAAAAASPIDDLRATADYRSSIVGTMIERALRTLASDRQAERWPTDPPWPGRRPSEHRPRPPARRPRPTPTAGLGPSAETSLPALLDRSSVVPQR